MLRRKPIFKARDSNATFRQTNQTDFNDNKDDLNKENGLDLIDSNKKNKNVYQSSSIKIRVQKNGHVNGNLNGDLNGQSENASNDQTVSNNTFVSKLLAPSR